MERLLRITLSILGWLGVFSARDELSQVSPRIRQHMVESGQLLFDR